MLQEPQDLHSDGVKGEEAKALILRAGPLTLSDAAWPFFIGCGLLMVSIPFTESDFGYLLALLWPAIGGYASWRVYKRVDSMEVHANERGIVVTSSGKHHSVTWPNVRKVSLLYLPPSNHLLLEDENGRTVVDVNLSLGSHKDSSALLHFICAQARRHGAAVDETVERLLETRDRTPTQSV